MKRPLLALGLFLLVVLFSGASFAGCSNITEGDTAVKKQECGNSPLEHRTLSLEEELYAYRDESDTMTIVFDVVNLVVVGVNTRQE